MLLRTSSAPVPTSSLHHYSKDYSSPESEPMLHLPRTTSVSPNTSKKSTQSFPDTDFRKNRVPHPHGISCKNQQSFKVKKGDEVENPLQNSYPELFSISGLDKRVVKQEEKTETMGGGMGSSGCGGHGSGWDSSNNGGDNTDAYYQKMIEADPDNALLLANYAKFLKEVVGDYAKAEEYLERAILASPGDGDVLSRYADLIWQTENNAERAEGYYDQAVKSAPNDCYVLASYAKFLWDAEQDEEWQHKSDTKHTHPPLTAPS